MPPANSPVRPTTPTDRQRATGSPSSFGAALQGLGSPVPDYAATLTYRVEDDVDADNIDFLRSYSSIYSADEDSQEPTEAATAATANSSTPMPTAETPSASSSPAQDSTQWLLVRDQRAASSSNRAEWRRVRLARHTAAPSTQEPVDQPTQQVTQQEPSPQQTSPYAAPYGDQLPQQQSLYDWAPAPEEGFEREVEDILAELRRSEPNSHADLLRIVANRENRLRPSHQRNSPSQQESSLRPAAILQSARRSWRLPNQSRFMSSFTPELDPNSATTSVSSATTLPPDSQTSSSRSTARDSRQNNPADRGPSTNTGNHPANYASTIRYSANPPMPTVATAPPTSTNTGNHPANYASTVRRIQNPNSYESSDSSPNSTESFRRRYLEHPGDVLHDFVKAMQYWYKLYYARKLMVYNENLDSIAPIPQDALCPPPTSWLAPGRTFTGEQQATSATTSSTTLHRLAQHVNALDDSNTPAISPVPPTASSRRPTTPPNRWTVKLAIHDVDYKTMTLQGTMEAYNVPSAPNRSQSTSRGSNNSSNQQSNSGNSDQQTIKTTFSTYLEGEIIDFINHPLQTESSTFGVKTNSAVDASYWRRLEPFAGLNGKELGDALRNPDWIRKNLTNRYVLMRWKERCFVRPTFTSFSGMGMSDLRNPAGFSNSNTPFVQQQSETIHRPVPPPPSESATTSFLSSADGNGYGLSISGFYYVSMRRSDGKCEGLYHDPASTPFQHLELRPTQGTWGCGAWEFR